MISLDVKFSYDSGKALSEYLKFISSTQMHGLNITNENMAVVLKSNNTKGIKSNSVIITLLCESVLFIYHKITSLIF